MLKPLRPAIFDGVRLTTDGACIRNPGLGGSCIDGCLHWKLADWVYDA
jgi:hypothetical protein